MSVRLRRPEGRWCRAAVRSAPRPSVAVATEAYTPPTPGSPPERQDFCCNRGTARGPRRQPSVRGRTTERGLDRGRQLAGAALEGGGPDPGPQEGAALDELVFGADRAGIVEVELEPRLGAARTGPVAEEDPARLLDGVPASAEAGRDRTRLLVLDVVPAPDRPGVHPARGRRPDVPVVGQANDQLIRPGNHEGLADRVGDVIPRPAQGRRRPGDPRPRSRV